jgi:hypothetical protein
MHIRASQVARLWSVSNTVTWDVRRLPGMIQAPHNVLHVPSQTQLRREEVVRQWPEVAHKQINGASADGYKC